MSLEELIEILLEEDDPPRRWWKPVSASKVSRPNAAMYVHQDADSQKRATSRVGMHLVRSIIPLLILSERMARTGATRRSPSFKIAGSKRPWTAVVGDGNEIGSFD